MAAPYGETIMAPFKLCTSDFLSAFIVFSVLQGCHRSPPPRSDSPSVWTDPSPHRVRFVTVEPGVVLEVLDWGGSGSPLVFLAGLQDVVHDFDDFAPQFTNQHHVFGITRRGYGASSQSPTGYDLARRVADVRAVLDSLHITRAALVGHSMAGDELTAFAGAYPDRVSRLVYLDAAYDHSARDMDRLFPTPSPMSAADSGSPFAVQAYTSRLWGVRIPEASFRATGRYDASGHLQADVTPPRIDSLVIAGCGHPNYRALRAPALIIYAIIDSASQIFNDWSAHDSTWRAAASRWLAAHQAWGTAQRDSATRAFPKAQVMLLHGAHHYVFYSHRRVVTDAMRRFLDSASPVQ